MSATSNLNPALPSGKACRICGRPLSDAKVLHRRYRKMRSGAGLGVRIALYRLHCECGHTLTKQGNVVSVPLQTRVA